MNLTGHVATGALILLVALTGCSRSIDFRIPENEVLSLQIRGDNNLLGCEISGNSQELDAIRAWLDRHPSQWEPSPVTYVPGVLVTGSGFSLNFMGGTAILNFEGGQFTRPVTLATYAHLACEGGT